MDWGIVGTIAGMLAILGVVYGIGRYAGKIDDLCRMKEKLPDSLIKVDTLWDLKDDISAAIIKIDTLWRIYIEDNLVRHSNPGGTGMLPDELKNEIKTLLNNNEYFGKMKEPTLLVIDRLNIQRLSEIARNNKVELGQVLAEVNSYVFSCLASCS
ncbi:unnamed protein product [marine sediment metagenome]|uniref:Uncharacterized protein n=1 Tax=marine sediment metagenome TaxID=412755 RepID=X1JXL9_9ZZZZ